MCGKHWYVTVWEVCFGRLLWYHNSSMQRKADALQSALSIALSSEEKPINLSTQATANLQRALTTGTRKISLKDSVWTQMQRAETVWSWDCVLQGVCTDVSYHFTFLSSVFCLNTCKFIRVAQIKKGNQGSCFLPLAAIEGFAFPEHLCSPFFWDASYGYAFWGHHTKHCLTEQKEDFFLGFGTW